MRKTATIAIIILTLTTLSACGRNGEDTAQSTPTPSTSTPQPLPEETEPTEESDGLDVSDPATARMLYIATLKQKYPELGAISRSNLIEIGEVACEKVADDPEIRELGAYMSIIAGEDLLDISQPGGASRLGFLLGVAFSSLCPEHSDYFESHT